MQSAVLSVMKVLLAGSFRGGEDEMANMKTVLDAPLAAWLAAQGKS